jgi:predicted lipoprotein with Yx(FWY)xxD motif
MSTRLPTLVWLAGAGLLTGGLAACGDVGGSRLAAQNEPPAPAAPAVPRPARGPVLVNRATTDLGVVATDRSGRTLYRFDEDDNKPPESTCEDTCARTWLPLTVAELPVPGVGVDGALLGTVPRRDGSLQATLRGWPLYRYVGDSAAGDTNGEGLGAGAWHAIAPSGKPAADQAPGSAAESIPESSPESSPERWNPPAADADSQGDQYSY